MRSFLRAALAALVLCGTAAFAAENLTDAAPAPVPVLGQFGLGLDVGIPDGATLMGVYRPMSLFRAMVGGSFNAVSPGLRLGVTVTPLDWLVQPSFTVEGGHFFTGTNDSILHTFVGSTGVAASTFKDLSYNYANLHLGVEFGGHKFGGFFHVGMSYVDITMHNFQQHLQDANATDSGTLEAADPSLRGWLPTFKLGLIFFL